MYLNGAHWIRMVSFFLSSFDSTITALWVYAYDFLTVNGMAAEAKLVRFLLFSIITYYFLIITIWRRILRMCAGEWNTTQSRWDNNKNVRLCEEFFVGQVCIWGMSVVGYGLWALGKWTHNIIIIRRNSDYLLLYGLRRPRPIIAWGNREFLTLFSDPYTPSAKTTRFSFIFIRKIFRTFRKYLAFRIVYLAASVILTNTIMEMSWVLILVAEIFFNRSLPHRWPLNLHHCQTWFRKGYFRFRDT